MADSKSDQQVKRSDISGKVYFVIDSDDVVLNVAQTKEKAEHLKGIHAEHKAFEILGITQDKFLQARKDALAKLFVESYKADKIKDD